MAVKGKQRFRLEINSASVGDEDPEIQKVQKFLTRFGYLTTTMTPGKLDSATSEALKTFQQVMGLKVTGKLNAETIQAIQEPRCGSPDVSVAARSEGGAVAGFVLRGCSYADTAFTYRFVNGTPDVSGTQERDAVRNAFDTWSKALCGVTFEERANGPVTFEIGWFSGDHNDGSNFDGVGNTLAHAFYPPPCGGAHAGEFHYDEAETWSLTGAGNSFDLETVALHEIGHLLGLDHSAVPNSVMFPSYGGVRRSLTQDDLDGIRRLYPTLCRRGDSGGQAGFVAEIAAVRHRQRQIITATRTQAGTLKLIGWEVAANGGITRTGDSASLAGAATSIGIARSTTGSRYVTCCRNGSGRLFLISWDTNSAGSAFTRLADSGTQAGTASMIRIVALSNNRFATACRDSAGKLRVITWQLNGNGTLTRLGDSGNQAGDVLDIALVALGDNRVLTAVRSANGSLLLISWDINAAGAVQRKADSGNQAGDARAIRATVDAFGHVVTAVKAANDDLVLITWAVSATGNIQRLGDNHGLAGQTRGHDISTAAGRVVTGVRTANNNVKVLLWNTANDGSITRIGDSGNQAGDATLITQCEELVGVPPIVTSVRTTTSSLKLISWSQS